MIAVKLRVLPSRRATSIVWELDKLALAEQEEFRRFAFQEAARYPIPKVGEQIRTLVDSLLPKD
jgi:hypothetical protein